MTSVPLVEQEPAIDSFEKVWRLCRRCLNEALEAGMDSEARACLACQTLGKQKNSFRKASEWHGGVSVKGLTFTDSGQVFQIV